MIISLKSARDSRLMPIPDTSSTDASYHSESAVEAVAEGSAGQEEIRRAAYGVEVDKCSKVGSPIQYCSYGRRERRIACNITIGVTKNPVRTLREF